MQNKKGDPPNCCLYLAALPQRRVKQDGQQMSQQQLRRSARCLEDGAMVSCISFRFFFFFFFFFFLCAGPGNGAGWPPAFWEKPYSELRTPTCFMLSVHISLHSRCLHRVCVCVQEFHIGRKWLNWWSDPTHTHTHTHREIGGLSQQTMK